MEQTVHVNLPDQSYSIVIKKGLLSELGQRIMQDWNGLRIFVLADRHVDEIHGDTLRSTLRKTGCQLSFFSLEPGEASKDLAHLQQVYEALASAGIQRSDLLLTFGGGVAGDLGGFAAATYLRGIPFMQIPTSLMAQADSSVGGKTAVNLPQGKNLVGSFYQPQAVWIDPDLLKTLPHERFADGFAEVVKYGCILDKELFERLEAGDRNSFMADSEELLRRCCSWKSNLVERDPHDRGLRMLLNFGHTIGHAVEAASGYSWSHGESVAAGMLQITKISEQKGLTAPGTSDRMAALLQRYGLRTGLPEMGTGELEKALLRDKKVRKDRVTVVLLREAGTAFLYETNMAFFNEVL